MKRILSALLISVFGAGCETTAVPEQPTHMLRLVCQVPNGKIGMLWMHESPATGAPDRKGYINLFNQKTVAAIEEVIAANRS